MKFKVTMILLLLSLVMGESTFAAPDWELQIAGLEFDQNSQSTMLGQEQLLITSQTRTFDQVYQIELNLINIFDQTIIKTVAVGNENEDNYSPQIITTDQYIYIAYINQVGSKVQVKMRKLDKELVDSKVEYIIGDSIESAKFDFSFCYIQLAFLNKDTIAVLWYSRSLQANQKQWNMKQFNHLTQEFTTPLILPDGSKISVAKNSLGIIAFAQTSNQQVYPSIIYLSKLSKDGILSTRTISDTNFGSLGIFSLPNNQFILAKFQLSQLFIRKYNSELVPISNPTQYYIYSNQPDQSQLYMIDYDLYAISSQQEVNVLKINVMDTNFGQSTRSFRTQNNVYFNKAQVDILGHNQLYIRVYHQTQYQRYKLSLLLFDMTLLVNDCIVNCKSCHPRFQCQQCQEGYQLINNKCIATCPTNCQLCSYPKYCDTCNVGFQYTFDNQCKTPNNNSIDLRISDETDQEGKPRLIVNENEAIIIYGVFGSDKSYLRIKRLNSDGTLISQTILQIDQWLLEDYDLTNGKDDLSFNVLVKWISSDSTQVINYIYDTQELSITSQNMITDKSPSMKGDSIKIENLKDNGFGYLFITFDQGYFVNYLRIDNDGIQHPKSNFMSFVTEGAKLQSYYNSNILYAYITTTDYLIQFYIQQDSLWQNLQIPSTQIDQNYQNIYYLFDQTILYNDYDDYQNKQIYLNATDSNSVVHKIQVTSTSRNPQYQSVKKIGESEAIVVWLGTSDIESSESKAAIYIQRVSLKTFSISDIKEMICSQNCKVCDDKGVCLECRNENYQLSNGKCKLICPQNCNLCSVEKECLSCQESYYLDTNLQCVESEQFYLDYQKNHYYINVFYSDDSKLPQVSLVFNETKYDVIFEEFDRKGNSISGEIRISDDNFFTLLSQPKVIKKNQFYYISYQTKYFQIEGACQQFVIMDSEYVIRSRTTQSDEKDFIVAPDGQRVYFLRNQITSSQQQLIINIYSISGQFKLDFSQPIQSPEFAIGTSYYRNLRFGNNIINSQIPILFTQVVDGIESDRFAKYDIKLNQMSMSDQHTQVESYMSLFSKRVVVSDFINNHLVKLQFYDEKQVVQNEYLLESVNVFSQLNLLTNDFNVYFVYVEQIQSNNIMQIQIRQHDLNGNLLKTVTINTMELELKGLSTAPNNEFISFAWTSKRDRTIYKTRLTKELERVAVYSELCMSNCEDCDTSATCNICSYGYQYDLENQICQMICSDNCLSCSKPYTCDYCIGDYKFINQQCQDITNMKQEWSICSDTCYGGGSIIQFDQNNVIVTYQNFNSQTFSIEAKSYKVDGSTQPQQQSLVISDSEIQYHQIFYYSSSKFALIWLSGNCQTQCRMMIQLFQFDLSLATNPYEIRVLRVSIDQFNLQIKIFNSDMLFIWTELDANDKPQSYMGLYNENSGLSVNSNINQNSDDTSIMAQLIIQSGYYQVVYVQNNNILNILTIDGTSITYKQIYTTNGSIISLSAIRSSYGIIVGWIEVMMDTWFTIQYDLALQLFDQDFNIIGPKQIFPTRYKEIHNLQLQNQYDRYIFALSYAEQEDENSQRIKVSTFQITQLYNGFDRYSQTSEPVNIASHYYYQNSPYLSYYADYDFYYFIFQGILDNKEQLFIKERKISISFLLKCTDNCFYCNSDNQCIVCKEGYELDQEECLLTTPDYCDFGDNGKCQSCSEGYSITPDGLCTLSDPQFKEMKMNTYSLQSKQRISTFSNGDYIAVWYRQYYENQGTGVFMSLFNAHGIKLIDETRISLSSAGIQVFPDVQVLLNDDFVCVWIDGDLEIGGQIKMQRFSKTMIRIGDEVVVKENITLKFAQRFDTPIMIQSISNGYVIVWTQSDIQSAKIGENLFISFYDQSGQQQQSYPLNNEGQLKNTEPVVASNTQIITIIWNTQTSSSDYGILTSVFSLNFILISQQMLSQSGSAPSIGVLNDGNILVTWRETVINSYEIMSQKIAYRKYNSDMSQLIFAYYLGEQDYNQNNPDVINTDTGFAIIYENIHSTDNNIRNLKLQLFNLDGDTTTKLITVVNSIGIYPHHPQLTKLPSGEFLASWTSSLLSKTSLNDDLYMKRYNSQGDQLLLSTVVCVSNCKSCDNNDQCTECMDGYILSQTQCQIQIPNCLTYQSDSSVLQCTSCNIGFELIQYQCIKINKQLELNVEVIADVTSQFKSIIFPNGNNAYFWTEHQQMWVQRFDSYGKALTLPKNLFSSYYPYQVFDVVTFNQEEKYVLAYQLDMNSQWLSMYDEEDQMIQQISINYNYSPNLFIAQQSLLKFAIRIKVLNNQQFAVFTMKQDFSSSNIQLQVQTISYDDRGSYILLLKLASPQTIIQFDAQQDNFGFDLDIVDNFIKILQSAGQKSRYIYYYSTFDMFGHQLSNLKIEKDGLKIEYQIKQINSTSYIEAWTQIKISSYEVFYQWKQFEGTNTTDIIKVSQSAELYKIGLRITQLTDLIVLTWREGSCTKDINENTQYKAALISKQSGFILGNVISLNYNLYSKANYTISVQQLPNLDIVFSFIAYNVIANSSSIMAVKVSPSGQQLEFSTFRCDFGCQECTNLGRCLKCYNTDGYLLTMEGKCIKKNPFCQNFMPGCYDCMEGYYKSKYQTCELIQQFIETQMNVDILQGSYAQRTVFYPNGNFIVVEQRQQNSLELSYMASDGAIIKERFVIMQITNDANSIKDWAVTIDEDNSLGIFVVLIWSTGQKNQYLYYQYDQEFTQVMDPKLIYNNYEYYQHNELQVKLLRNQQVGVIIRTGEQIYFAVYNRNFNFMFGNTVLKIEQYSTSVDFISNDKNIIIAMAYNEGSIVKIYDQKMNFIRDRYLNDGWVIKVAVNNFNQFVLGTQYQLNIITTTDIIYSVDYKKDPLFPIQVGVNSLDEIFVLSSNSQQIFLSFYNAKCQKKYEEQINMQTNPDGAPKMSILQNKDLIISFSGYSKTNYQFKGYLTQFDQYGKSKPFGGLVCPKNCDICTSNSACQICSSGYFRIETTLECSKICTVKGCKSCEVSDCDICQDGLQLDSTNNCVIINQQPITNEYQVMEQCIQPFDEKTVIFSNNDYAILYLCQNQLFVRRFNMEGQELSLFTTTIQSQYKSYDATVAFDTIYLSVVFYDTDQMVNVYKIDSTSTSILLMTTISRSYSITKTQILGLQTYYFLLISENQQCTFDNIYQYCVVSTYYIYDQSDSKMIEQSNTPVTIDECNNNVIKYIKAYDNFVYLITNQLTDVKITIINSVGLVAIQILPIPPIDEIYFDLDQTQLVFLYKQIGSDIWKLQKCDLQQICIPIDDHFLEGNYEIALAITDTSIVISWSSKSTSVSILEYKILDKLGALKKMSAISNSSLQMHPSLLKLNQNIVCFSWSSLTTTSMYALSYALINQDGNFEPFGIVCSANCQSCTSSTYCTQCFAGYNLIIYPNFQQCGKKCDPYCLQCNIFFGMCERCIDNYSFQDGTCVVDEVQRTAIQVNQFSELSQIQPNGVSFQDGSLLVVWSSINEDGDSWGVYAQLHNNQGQKIGDNIQVSQSTQGTQHSPSVAILQDDSAIVLFIDGNPKETAQIKGVRFSNQLSKIGNEQLFASFTNSQFDLNLNQVACVQSLSNGGFVIMWVSYDGTIQLINLQFYDLAGNLVVQNQITSSSIIYNMKLNIASTSSDIAVLYSDQSYLLIVNTYSFEGVLISSQAVPDWNKANSISLSGFNLYYAITGITYSPNQQQVVFQLYYNTFIRSGDQITVSTLQQSGINWISNIKVTSFNSGVRITEYISTGYSNYQQQHFVDLNWQVTQMPKLYISSLNSYWFQITIIESINDQYFAIWAKDQMVQSDSSNILLQRFTKSGTLIPINEIVCPRDCLSCDSTTSCNNCINRYQIIDNQCTPICESNCSYCTVPSICDICSDGYYQPIEGKCNPIPITYYQPEILLTYTVQANSIGLDHITSDSFVLYTQQTLFSENKEIFELFVIQNKQQLKKITASVDTVTTSYYTIQPFYFEDCFVLIFYYPDKIVVRRFNSQSELLLDQQVVLPSIVEYLNTWNIVIEPVENNQYSLIYISQSKTTAELEAYHIMLDSQFTMLNDPTVLWSSNTAYISSSTKTSKTVFDFSQNFQIVITKDNINIIQCVPSQQSQQQSCQIFPLTNGNKVQIIQSWNDINNYNQYFTSNLVLYYRILDSSNTPLTKEAKVIDNNYLRQNLINVYVFDNSFTILVEQMNYYRQDISQLLSQRFDNSGMKIESFQFIESYKNWAFKKDIPIQDGYMLVWEFNDYSTSNSYIYSKQFNQLGEETSWSSSISCISNCNQCKNKFYCETCNPDYELDTNYQCQLKCPDNCNACQTVNECQTCDLGYSVVSGACAKILCITNCGQCLTDGTCNVCEDNYQFTPDKSQCQPICPSNCSSCTIPLQCDTCAFGYIVTADKKCQSENTSVLNQIQNTSVGTPVIATFPNGDYIMLWYQSGDNAGVYFQLYTKDNVKQGDPTKIGGVRRLLQSTSISQQFAADLATSDNEFVVLWMDATSTSTNANIQKFNSAGEAQSDIKVLGSHKQVNLSSIKLPCQIKKTQNNNFLITYLAQDQSNNNQDYSMYVSTLDSALAPKGIAKEFKKVNELSAPTITADENGVISLTYLSEGYVFVQQLTEDGDTIDQPQAISDSNSMVIRTANLADGIMIFLWENKNLQLSQPQFNLNFQLISKDLKTRSEIKSVGTTQNAQLSPDIQSFNEGFIVAWKITDTSYKPSGLQFQIFDSLGTASTEVIDVEIEGLYPQNPRIQIISETQFAVTWTAKNVDIDGSILGDGIFMQKYNQQGILVADSSSTDLCSYQCQSCQSPLVCLKCQYGFYLNATNYCSMDCGSFCETCEIPWTCEVCKNGYTLFNNNSCVESDCSEGYERDTTTKLCEPKCPQECDSCKQPNICEVCKVGYSLSDANCVTLNTTTALDNESTILAIIIIVLAAGLISMTACSITQYCRYKKILKATQPSYCQVHPQQDLTINNRSVTASCNISVLRPHDE